MSRFWRALVLTTLLLCPALAWAQEATPQEGFVVEPSFWISTFVTDKGALTRTFSGDETRELAVHTGSFNWILLPSVFTGWAWGDWLGGLRISYPVQFANLNLPYGDSASGLLQSLEVGPEFAYRLFDFHWTTVEAQFGAAARFLSRGVFDYEQGEEAADFGSRDFHWAWPASGWALHAGVGGDLMRGEHVLLGWLFRFYWGRHELLSEETRTQGVGDDTIEMVEERYSLDVYSAFIGFRLRIFPVWSAQHGNQ